MLKWTLPGVAMSLVLFGCGTKNELNAPMAPLSQSGAGAGGSSAGGAAGTAGRSSAGAPAGSGAAGASGQPGSAGTSGGAGTGAGGSSGAAGTAGASGAGGAAGTAGAGGDSALPMTGTFPPVTDVGAAGPYTPVTKTGTGPSGGYTLYHPQQLAPDGRKHPIVTWGNGATTVPSLFPMLPHLASHGFVVIASDNAFVTSAELKAGIDWLIMENDRMGSDFYQKLDPAQVTSMGYSLGSLGTFEIAADPRLKTTVHISGGAMNKSVVPNLKNPAIFLCGDESDIAHANCETDFQMATVPVFYGVFPGEHLGILASHTDQITEAVTAWLRWRLMADRSLAPMFEGPDCTLCKDSRWVVKQKDL